LTGRAYLYQHDLVIYSLRTKRRRGDSRCSVFELSHSKAMLIIMTIHMMEEILKLLNMITICVNYYKT